jgi:hypothetical protein
VGSVRIESFFLAERQTGLVSNQPGPPDTGGIDWGGIYLRASVFASGMGRNFVDEFKKGGCVRTFIDAAADGGILPDLPSGFGLDEMSQKFGEIAAAQYRK